MGRLTMRTGQAFPGVSIDPVTGIIAGFAASQSPLQLLKLPCRQFAKLPQPPSE